ncbi:hypothetical protein KQ873_02850 [Mycoplasma zalophidermidis]|uniref:hypothetical protein n=1 Tax=Mycoplasma zalophidermidis TaxID=398174 RepID=UPI001C124B7E|nr:hypothetical protein [Mycoplasma zalophidermidis]MBU4689962.1 hypothetical protein [Mycoplasma zalophidermidis]
MLKEFFELIQNNRELFSNVRDGNDFEQNIKQFLHTYCFTEIRYSNKTDLINRFVKFEPNMTKDEIKDNLQNIKDSILSKTSFENIENPFQNLRNNFIYQPYGSQQFPDFLIFINDYIIPVEVKFNKNPNGDATIYNTRPMWNSNVPKLNAIYIYGIANVNTTFFIGGDILNGNVYQSFNEYWDRLNEYSNNIVEEIIMPVIAENENNFGFWPYIRKAFDQKVDKSTYFRDNKRTYESYFSENMGLREQNVINFAKELDDNES